MTMQRLIALAAVAALAACGGPLTRIEIPNVATSKLRIAAAGIAPGGVQYRKIFGFNGSDGSWPTGLVWSKGLFFGLAQYTKYRAKNDAGVAFTLKLPSTVRIVHRFGLGSDGKRPQGALTVVGTDFYGATLEGGKSGSGTVFSLNRSGTEQWRYSFKGDPDGSAPESGLTNVKGTLYGTTSVGGTTCSSSGSCGTVFSITTSGKEKVLHKFTGNGKDGEYPFAPPTALNGTLFGTTFRGGLYDEGAIYSLTSAGKEKLLHSFGAGNDGLYPQVGLIAVNGVLYGTAPSGGKHQDGIVFRITTTGKEQVLYDFGKSRNDGRGSYSPLVFVNGMFYGTTSAGGTAGRGTVFSLSPGGKETVLYSFNGGTDGRSPAGALVYFNGVLYGVTISGGGIPNYWTIFSLKP